jgi:hypothetical protein
LTFLVGIERRCAFHELSKSIPDLQKPTAIGATLNRTAETWPTDGIVSEFFFDVVCQYLTNKVSVIIEAAFQHKVWEPRMPKILELSLPLFIVCSIDEEIAAQRHLQRGLADPNREFYHSDKRVSVHRATGEIGTPGPYVAPNFNVPTVYVSTENDYSPNIDEIAHQVRSQNAQQADELDTDSWGY